MHFSGNSPVRWHSTNAGVRNGKGTKKRGGGEGVWKIREKK
jgi:hypothetical protein